MNRVFTLKMRSVDISEGKSSENTENYPVSSSSGVAVSMVMKLINQMSVKKIKIYKET